MLQPSDSAQAGVARATLIADAQDMDGQPPFSDQSLVDADSGARASYDLVADDDERVGAAIAADDPAEFEFVIAPNQRGKGYGGRALDELLALYDGDVLTWAHGDHPAAARLAASVDLDRVRTLFQLRRSLEGVQRESAAFDRFDPERDADDWVRLNARVFADHPEQGRLTRADLDARMAEPWFRADDMLVARSESGALIGYNWLKIVDGIGEIYVLGVAPEAAGSGLGRALTVAGLAHLAERGCATAALYVDDENARAVRLYRSLGFTDHTVDVQYRRATAR